MVCGCEFLLGDIVVMIKIMNGTKLCVQYPYALQAFCLWFISQFGEFSIYSKQNNQLKCNEISQNSSVIKT
jgi:hypothetical protein